MYSTYMYVIYVIYEKLLKVAPFILSSYKRKERIMYKPSTNHVRKVHGNLFFPYKFLTMLVVVKYMIYILFIYDHIYVFCMFVRICFTRNIWLFYMQTVISLQVPYNVSSCKIYDIYTFHTRLHICILYVCRHLLYKKHMVILYANCYFLTSSI